MTIIQFHYPDEFIEELKKEPLAKPVVRLTNLRRLNEKLKLEVRAGIYEEKHDSVR